MGFHLVSGSNQRKSTTLIIAHSRAESMDNMWNRCGFGAKVSNRNWSAAGAQNLPENRTTVAPCHNRWAASFFQANIVCLLDSSRVRLKSLQPLEEGSNDARFPHADCRPGPWNLVLVRTGPRPGRKTR